jgi:preprotein translocase subunit SecA
VHLETLHIMNQCLRAHTLYKRDVNYMVSPDGKVLIIDEFTGRVLPGRRWSDGLHQAVEAKEHVPIQEESRTMATITFQNLFRIYKKLAGMTGTADTEASEFHSTYKLDVVIIPTNKPIVRDDAEDIVYKTEREKFSAVIKELAEFNERGQPVLVGTTSVEKSAAIARILQKKNIPHNVLNAKHHAKEAQVIAQAGRKGAITVSTNMAGRGTDIILGGNAEMMAKIEFLENNRLPDAEPEAFQKLVEQYEASCAIEREEVVSLGGLHILGTERHESRRIDNQLRGRAGRQGDPGSSRFYLSLEDDLMRIFAGDKVKNLMDRMGMPDDEPIEHPWVTKSVQNAQQKVEERNFDIRKNLLEYDDVMSAQRKTVYTMRQQMLEGRYRPEEVDEDGKPTGDFKGFAARPDILGDVVPRVTEVLGMFSETPIRAQATDAKSTSTLVPREAFENAKMVELAHLQSEVYQWWGVKIDVEGRETDALGLYDELTEMIPLALTEQRERLLDLVDRIIGAMVEESCPGNKTPDDWDWGGLREGFTEHFGVPPGENLESFGDQELLARALYARAFEVVSGKEKELGIELLCRVFRHLYLEEIDRAWVEHLTNMDHLRDGIGLRGYGQKDPKQEYKKEGYDLFVNMMASVCSLVVTNLLRFKVRRQEEIAAIEQQDMQKHTAQLEAATARHGEDEEGALAGSAPRGGARRDVALPPPAARSAPKIGRNDLCPCGSGKKFKKCHGTAEGTTDEGEDATA